MKNVLIISYYYPPLGGGGVQRTLKFAKYLSKKGYNISVLTVEEEKMTVKDDTLKDEILSKIKVYRAKMPPAKIASLVNKVMNSTKTGEEHHSSDNIKPSYSGKVKTQLKKAALKIYLNMYVPDNKIGWKHNAVEKAMDILKSENIDLIYSTSAPYTCHLIAYELKKKTGLPWIADFRDPWTTNRYSDYFLFTEYLNKKLESKVVESADAVISVSEPLVEEFVNRYPNINIDKFKLITNGYDELDFEQYNNIIVKNKKFTITFTGTLYGEDTPADFFKALDNLLISKKINKDEILIRFIGNLGSNSVSEINTFIDKYPNTIECTEYLPHKESIKKLEDTSALLFILNGGEECKGIYSGKIFEYARSFRPIIAIVPEGVARNLIVRTNTGFCCYPKNIDEVEKGIYEAYCIWNETRSPLQVNIEEVSKYERSVLADKLSEIIEKLTIK